MTQDESSEQRRRARRRLLSQPPVEPEPAAPAERAPSLARRERRRELSRPDLDFGFDTAEADAPATERDAGPPSAHPAAPGAREPINAQAPRAPRVDRSVGRVGAGGDRLAPPRRPHAFPWKRLIGFSLLGVLLFVAAAATAAYVVVERMTADLPSVEALKAGYNPPQITRIYARDETLLASVFTERRTVIDFDQIPNSTKLAFLAAEDASFYEHQGLNYLGMLRALAANLRAGHTVQGGSTITQQVVKNVLLDQERSYRRKIRETVLARRLEASLSKDEIFWLYLNHIYLGHGRYGIEEAARYYFGKHAKALRVDEATVLAGLVASPERYSPRRDAQKSLTRRRYVLDQMRTKGFITSELHQQVLALPLRLAPAEESESKLAPEMVERAKRALSDVLRKPTLTGGYSIRTTLDPALQAAGRTAVRANLDAYMLRHKLVPPFTAPKVRLWGDAFSGVPQLNHIYVGTVVELDDHAGTIAVRVGDRVGRVNAFNEPRYNPKRVLPSEFTKVGAALRVAVAEEGEGDTPATLRLELGPQSALVAIDVRSRDVVALVGGYDAVTAGLDRATQAKRQPGSSFKPIVFSYGIHSRQFTPATPLPVKKPGHGVPDTGPLSITFRNGLAFSNNDAAEAAYLQSGPTQIVAWARLLGIQSRLEPDLSLALGSYEVTPLELLNVYVDFANGGVAGPPQFVSRITGPDGNPVALPTPAEPQQVMTAEEAYLTTSLLRSVVEVGTGRAARAVGREVAGKTGTTNKVKDAWFAGYSTDLAAIVWVGFDDARPLGEQESGATTALPAWVQFMKAAHENKPKTRFVQPSSVLSVAVDPTTGLLPAPGQTETVLEEFLPGTEPSTFAPVAAPTETTPDNAQPAVGEPEREPEADGENIDGPDER